MDFFKDSAIDQWAQDESGSIQFSNERNDKYSLTMNYADGKGISISYDLYNSKDKQRNFFVFAEGEAEIGPDFEFLENGTAVPVGSFLPFDTAWSVVKSFLQDPEKMPPSVKWVSSESPSLNWPEELK